MIRTHSTDKKFTKRPNIIEAMENFSGLKQAVRRAMMPLFKNYDISGQQWHMLWLLSKHKQGMTTTELAEIAHITPGAVSQFVDQLADKAFIDRRPSPGDRRVTIISVATEALEPLSELKAAYKKILAESFDCLSNDELTQFITLLQKVSDHAKTVGELKHVPTA